MSTCVHDGAAKTVKDCSQSAGVQAETRVGHVAGSDSITRVQNAERSGRSTVCAKAKIGRRASRQRDGCVARRNQPRAETRAVRAAAARADGRVVGTRAIGAAHLVAAVSKAELSEGRRGSTTARPGLHFANAEVVDRNRTRADEERARDARCECVVGTDANHVISATDKIDVQARFEGGRDRLHFFIRAGDDSRRIIRTRNQAVDRDARICAG